MHCVSTPLDVSAPDKGRAMFLHTELSSVQIVAPPAYKVARTRKRQPEGKTPDKTRFRMTNYRHCTADVRAAQSHWCRLQTDIHQYA